MRAKVLSLVCLTLCLALIAPLGLAQSDPLSGTWTGDWGPTPQHRNPVTVELTWDGSTLTGTVNPGPDAVELGATSFDPATGMVKMEADAESFRGTVHFVIEGKLEGNTMMGSWNHDNRTGDFTITKSE